MPPLINVRPASINLAYYPGSPITLTFTFPAGYLATVTFKTFLNGRGDGGVEGTCVESTDTLTVSFEDDETDQFDFPVDWELSLFTAGVDPAPDTYIPQFVGTWTPGTDGNDGPVNAAFTVTTPANLTVQVTSANLPGADGAPGAAGAAGADGADGVVQTVVAGTNVSVNSTDPANPIVSATGLALANGDYGDVTVTSAGAVITIDNAVVTLAKMANLAESTIIGRAAAAGTGVPTALTASQVRTAAGVVIGTDVAAASEPIAAAHIIDGTAAHAASAIAFTPAGGLSSTDTQAAIVEAAALPGATFLYTLNAQTGTTYTPVLGDLNKLVTLNNASAITLTLPQNSAVAFAIGTQINFQQIGAGAASFVAGTGATVTSTPGLNLRDQYSLATAIKVGTNAWTVVGDLAA